MQPTQLILNTAYVDAEQMQQTVWYWRRQQAGQLQTDLPEAPAPPEMFDGPTVARADAAFLARYGRAPVAQEFLTAYRLILENIQRDPEFYASTIHRANLPATPLFLSILPGTAKPRRTVRQSGSGDGGNGHAGRNFRHDRRSDLPGRNPHHDFSSDDNLYGDRGFSNQRGRHAHGAERHHWLSVSGMREEIKRGGSRPVRPLLLGVCPVGNHWDTGVVISTSGSVQT